MMKQHLHYFYLRNNTDWDNKIKYGYVYGNEENLINRIYDSSSEHSELSQYIGIYGFHKSDIYKNNIYYKEIDKIISLCSIEAFDKLEKQFSIELPYLREIQQYKVASKTKKSNEFIYKEGITIIKNILEIEYPLLGLELVKTFTENEIEEINNASRQRISNNVDNTQIIIVSKKKEIETQNKGWNERTYQIEISDYIKKSLLEIGRIYLELATGGGKSYILYKTLHFFEPEVIIIFSPRKNINSQNANKKYLSLLENKYCVYNCSKQNNFEYFYRKTIENNKKIMLVACPQMANKKIFKYIQEYHLQNIFIWFDEAHHTIENWVNRLDEPEKAFFMNDNVKISKRVFTSASPDAKHIEKYPDIFGEHYFPITVKELISLGWLCPLKPYMYSSSNNNVDICVYNLDGFKQHKCSYGFSFHNTRENAYSLFKEHANKYLADKTHIKPFLLVGDDYVNEELEYWNKKLDYDFRDIQIFEETIYSIGYVVQQYSIGYDFHKLDFMVFSDPKMSIKDIIQCIGRGTRPDKLGENGTNKDKNLKIFLPIFIEDELEQHNFNRIEGVLRYLIYDIEIPFEEIEMNFHSNGGEGSDLGKEYKGTEDMSAILLDLLRGGKYSELSEKKCIEILRNNKIHNNGEYLEYLEKRPELNLPKDIFLNYPNFYWEKTYMNRKGENLSPHYRRNEITEKLHRLCEENEISIHDYEEPERELHKIDSKIPPVALFRFYGGNSNDVYY